MQGNTYSQSGVNQLQAQAYQQGQGLQNQYNQQVGQQYGAYQGAQNQANQSYQNLQNYTNQMANPADQYSQYLTGAQQMYGFNPQELLKASQNLANTQTTLANLPQAVQQQGNYYGTTAGQTANAYANQAGNVQNVLAGQSNAVNAFQNVLQATQQQANQQATLGLQGEQLKSQNLTNLYQTSVQQMQQTGAVLSQLENLQQQQGYLTAQQVAQYQGAYNGYISARAAATQAQASMISAQAQAGQINQQVALIQQIVSKFGLQGVAQALGVPSSALNQVVKTGKPQAQAPKMNANQITATNTGGTNLSTIQQWKPTMLQELFGNRLGSAIGGVF